MLSFFLRKKVGKMGGTLYFKTDPSILGGDFMVSYFFLEWWPIKSTGCQKKKKTVETPDPN